MGTTAEKLCRILDSKRAIKEALEAKGVVITDETTFSEYAEKINEITNGGAITDEEALLFIKDVAEGKRKIAKAVRNKYEGTKGEASEVTEYSTFDELSNKISQIPIEVPLGSAMEQNGGVLPFFDVYNETLKAMASVGTEFNGCCAFELDKWSYDNDHKVTLSGADAYYTSDGTFIDKDFNIKENGSVVGKLELTGENSALYQFQEQDKENINRFVVFFFTAERYTVPKCLPATSCLNLWCVKGTPLMSFNGDFTSLNSINVYDGELVVKDANDFKFSGITLNQKLRLSHIEEIVGVSGIFNANANLQELSLPNLTTISGGSIFSGCDKLREINLPNLETIENTYLFTGSVPIKELYLPRLYYFYASSTPYAITNTTLKRIKFPSLHTARGLLGNNSTVEEINLGDAKGADIQYVSLVSNNKTLKKVIIENGFQGNLHLAYCTALTTDSVHAIIDNLAPCDTKGQYTITLSNSVTINEEYENKLVNEKLYTLARLG